MALSFRLLSSVLPLFLLFFLFTRRVSGGMTDDQRNRVVNTHNYVRSRMNPRSSNMRKMFWSDELAENARRFARRCDIASDGDTVGRIFHILTNFDENTDLADVIQQWRDEGSEYDFPNRRCRSSRPNFCNHFLQLVWAHTCKIGCDIFFCPSVVGHEGSNVHLLACDYSPAPPRYFNRRRPYRIGTPCSTCGRYYPQCTVNYDMLPDDYTSNLCYNTEDACIGSDPHFGIRLPEGSLLCYTFQGEHNSTFNIISNSQFKMNALFVPDSRRVNNTWIGSIGITVYHNGKKMTTLQFIAADNTIIIASRLEVDAYTVGKISFHQENYTIVDATYKNSSRFPRVDVEFLDSDLKFTVAFVKDQHINLEWHSVGEPFMDSRGVVGQFFRKGVKIEEDQQMLYIPGRSPVPVVRRGLWHFMKHNLADETKCWTSVLPSNQGVGLIEGTWTDYRVDSLLADGH